MQKCSFPKFGDFEGQQPVPAVDAGDVSRVVVRDFAEELHDQVLAILDELEPEDEEVSARIYLAALKLSGGDLDRLISQVAAAIRDWRDVVAAAEYPAYLQIRNPAHLPSEERARVIQADWVQYQEWLGQ